MAGADGPDRGRDVARYVGTAIREVDPSHMVGRATASEHLRGPHGGIRTGALLTFLDNVGGLGGGVAALPDGWVVSTNLAARILRTEHVGPFRVEAEVLRRGRHAVVTAVRALDEGARDALVADGVLTSAILVPEGGPPQWQRPVVIATPPPDPACPPIEQWLGVRPVDDGAGTAVEIDLADPLRNPWGILHGGVVAMLVDLAAEAASGGETTDVALHFLAPNRLGPVRAVATPLGRRADGAVTRVEVRDEGAGRVTAVAVATSRRSVQA
jgi:uncharacterized protein (TIGR00369 family)